MCVSRRLIDLLIEQKNYVAAAECVSGSEATFVFYSQMIADTISNSHVPESGNRPLELQRILDTARIDIQEHEKWEDEVREGLSKTNLTAGPLQEALRRSALVRDALLQEVKGVEWIRGLSGEPCKKNKSS